MVGEARTAHRGHAVSFAELNGLMDGCPACRKQHTAADVLAFFKIIDRSVPRSQDIHVVLGCLSAHKAPETRDWLAHPRRARWHLHLTPHLELMAQPRAAMVQGTHRSARRRGTFTSVPALIEAIQTWVTRRNQDPKPFICRAAAGETPEKVRRGRRPLSQVKSTTQHQSTDGSEGPAALRFGVPIVRSSTRLAVRPVMLRRPG